MKYTALRKELRAFYDALEEKAYRFNEVCSAILEKSVTEDMPAARQKAILYEVIAQEAEPAVFRNSSFYYEPATMSATTQGEGENSRAPLAELHPGGWLYRRNRHKFVDADPVLFENSRVPFYSWCGEYGDFRYHFTFNIKPVLSSGLRSLYEKAEAALQTPCTDQERIYLESTLSGLLSMKKLIEKFAAAADKALLSAESDEEKTRLSRISKTARRVPWEAPATFYEALNTIALIGKLIGAMEGVNNTDMGRLDLLLLPFYENDLKEGRITPEEAQDLITEFLLLWECHFDMDKKHEGTHNFETMVYTLGGCDESGAPVFNDLTQMFLRAHQAEKLIFPKRKCRYSDASPKEYLDMVNSEILSGSTTVLYLNDNALIPAFEKLGFPTEIARDYTVLGCWEPVLAGATNEHCGYVNLIKILESSVYKDWVHPEIFLSPLDGAKDFEEVYSLTLQNLLTVLRHKCHAAYEGRKIWPEVDPMLLISSALDDCIETKRDYTAGGARYKVDELVCAGLVNVVNSLLVIRELVFEKKEVSLETLLGAVRANWKNAEGLRQEALKCRFWGDESEESGKLMARILHDLYEGTRDFPVLYGGRISLGYMLYLELYNWAKSLRATPDGRHTGDFFERGLTPSILHKIKSVTSVVNSMRYVDPSEIGADSVVNVTLSLKSRDADAFEAFMRASALTGIQAFQVNCVTREELLAARETPEKFRDLVVRVCGYSAKFVTLSDEVQDEFLQRNFMEA